MKYPLFLMQSMNVFLCIINDLKGDSSIFGYDRYKVDQKSAFIHVGRNSNELCLVYRPLIGMS